MKPAAFRLMLILALGVVAGPPAAAAAPHGSLRAGAARVDITPPVNPQYPPSGKYAHERLYIRAIVLDNGVARAALIGADQGNLPVTLRWPRPPHPLPPAAEDQRAGAGNGS